MKILLVDDHQWIHDSVTLLLEKNGYRVISAYKGEEAIAIVEGDRPDLVIMDISMPEAETDGIEACREIKARYPDIPVLIFTSATDFTEWWRPYAQSLLAGANGFVEKGRGKKALLQSIELALQGRKTFDPQRTKEALAKWQAICEQEMLYRKLSARELDVLQLIRRGLTNKEIAEELTLSVETVRWHIGHILAKLQVSSRAGAAGFGIK